MSNIDRYEAAWKILLPVLVQKEIWTKKELGNLISLIEIQLLIGLLGELNKQVEETKKDETSSS